MAIEHRKQQLLCLAAEQLVCADVVLIPLGERVRVEACRPGVSRCWLLVLHSASVQGSTSEGRVGISELIAGLVQHDLVRAVRQGQA